jgi:hypothetical protein
MHAEPRRAHASIEGADAPRGARMQDAVQAGAEARRTRRGTTSHRITRTPSPRTNAQCDCGSVVLHAELALHVRVDVERRRAGGRWADGHQRTHTQPTAHSSRRLTAHEVRGVEELVAAEEDVEVDVRLRERGHVRVLRGARERGPRPIVLCRRGERTRATSLRSMRSRIGACTPYTLRAIVSLRLSCVSFHCDARVRSRARARAERTGGRCRGAPGAAAWRRRRSRAGAGRGGGRRGRRARRPCRRRSRAARASRVRGGMTGPARAAVSVVGDGRRVRGTRTMGARAREERAAAGAYLKGGVCRRVAARHR